MKRKVLAILMAALLVASLAAGCSSTPPAQGGDTTTDDSSTDDTDTTDDTEDADTADDSAGDDADASSSASIPMPDEGKLITSQGVSTSISSSTSATADAAGNVQVDSTLATVTWGSDGTITKCVLDAAQQKIAIDATGAITSDLTAAQQTKDEMGAAYGMNWDEQAAAFAEATIGKTLEEVQGMAASDGSVDPSEADLASTVSIHVNVFVSAIEAAMYNADTEASEFDEVDGYTTGMGTSIALSGDDATSAQVDNTIASVSMGPDGTILACVIDVAQTEVEFDATGTITTDKDTEFKTKDMLGDDYGMKARSAIGKEWFEQAKAFSTWAIGKTVDEVKGLPLTTGDEAGAPDDPDLASSVSIGVEEFIAAIEKAATNAN